MDGYWLPPTEPTVCIKDCICKGSIQTQVTSGHPLRLSYTALYLYLQKGKKKKTCIVHRIKNKQTNKKKQLSSFNKKGLPKVIASIPQPLSRAIFKTHHTSHKATHLRMHRNQPFQEEGKSEFGLPYQLSHLAAGTEKPVIGVAAAPAANSTTAEPSLWEIHQIKLSDQ